MSRFFGVLVCFAALAAQEPSERPSLAEAARKAREKKATEPKATKVFDNESVSKGKASTPFTPEPEPITSPKPTPAKATSDLERAYRTRFANLRIQLAMSEERAKMMADLMAKYSPTSVTVEHYYYDPKKLKELQTAIDTNNKRMADLKKQLADLGEELRRKGLPSGWAL